MARVLVVGVAVVDFVFSVKTLPREAAKYRAADAAIVGGGCAANAAVAIARAGGEAVLAGRLGDDAIGEMILRDLAAEGVDVSLMQRCPGGRSSFSSVFVDAAGERQIVNYRGAGLDIDAGFIASAGRFDAVLADTRWPPGTAAAMALARRLGVPGVLDVEAPLDGADLSGASHLAFSRDGLAAHAGEGAPASRLAEVAAATGAWACVTDGAHGVLYCGRDGAGHVPAFTVAAVDTLGAGDIWHGAFALALAEGRDEIAAIAFANAAAAIKCTRFGGRAGTPTRDEIEAFLKERQA